jgi:hypothetical protein
LQDEAENLARLVSIFKLGPAHAPAPRRPAGQRTRIAAF